MSDVVLSPMNQYPKSFISSSGSSLNPEVERDHYREKVEHFRILVQKLQEENQAYKLKKESTETVSKLLHESKHETAALNRKCLLLDATIRTLQSRLEAHGLSSEVVPQEGEQYIPGPSKTVLDNLTRENKRLRNLVKSKSGDPEEYAKLQQRCEETEKECSELRLHLNNQQSRYAELEQLLRASDNEKDKTINELRENLNHVQRELTSRDTLCCTLSEETHVLQKQLEDVAQQCQELAKRLQEKGQAPDKQVQTALKSCIKDSGQTSTLAEEVSSLKQKLKEITDMNKRWQEYNNQRDAYVKTLLSENSDIRKRLTELEGAQTPADVQIEMNKILDEARRLSRAKDDQTKLVTRVSADRDRIKKELDKLNKDIIALRSDNHRLKRQLESGNTQDNTETIAALKAQIGICTEDFESERRDRERAQSKIVRLENEIGRLKKEIESFKRDPSRWQTSPNAPYNDPFFHHTSNTTGSSSEGLAARGCTQVTDQPTVSRHVERDRYVDRDQYNVIDSGPSAASGGVEHGTENNGTENNVNILTSSNDKEQTYVMGIKHIPHTTDVNDEYVPLNTLSLSPPKERSLSASPQLKSRGNSPCNRASPVSSSELLLCPKCNKEFTTTQHPELLDHIEHCAN